MYSNVNLGALPGLTIPYFYVAQHTHQRDEKCDRVPQYFDYCVTG